MRLEINKTGTAELFLYDDIGGQFGGVTAKEFSKELRGIKSKELIVRINSSGGEIMEGFAIYNQLKAFNGNVTTWVDGAALSIASVIAQAGAVRYMADNSWLMIHNPWAFVMGGSDKLRREADVLDDMRGKIVRSYVRNGSNAEQIESWMAAETWFNSDEALDAGLVDEVSEMAATRAAFNPRLGFTPPAMFLDATKAKPADPKRLEILRQRHQALLTRLKRIT